MAYDTWGGSFGTSWSTSWTVTPTVATGVGGFPRIDRLRYQRKRYELTKWGRKDLERARKALAKEPVSKQARKRQAEAVSLAQEIQREVEPEATVLTEPRLLGAVVEAALSFIPKELPKPPTKPSIREARPDDDEEAIALLLTMM